MGAGDVIQLEACYGYMYCTLLWHSSSNSSIFLHLQVSFEHSKEKAVHSSAYLVQIVTTFFSVPPVFVRKVPN